MGDSVPKHTGPISLTDTHLEPSVLRTRPTTTRENRRRWKGLIPRDTQAACRFNGLASNSTPFSDRNAVRNHNGIVFGFRLESRSPSTGFPSNPAFKRYMQMSQRTKVFVFVEGFEADPYFYGQFCEQVFGAAACTYEIVGGWRLAQTGGKTVLMGFHAYLATTHSLLGTFQGKCSVALFFLDKDIDDVLHSPPYRRITSFTRSTTRLRTISLSTAISPRQRPVLAQLTRTTGARCSHRRP